MVVLIEAERLSLSLLVSFSKGLEVLLFREDRVVKCVNFGNLSLKTYLNSSMLCDENEFDREDFGGFWCGLAEKKGLFDYRFAF